MLIVIGGESPSVLTKMLMENTVITDPRSP